MALISPQTPDNFEPALKTIYADGIEDLTYPNNILFAKLKKDSDFVGSTFDVPLKIAPTGGVGRDFTYAKGNKNALTVKKFVVPRRKEYVLASIENELVEASATNTGAFVRGLKYHVDDAFEQCARRIGQALYGSGTGKIGSVSSPGASTTLTLEYPDHVVNFFLGQTLVFAADEASALRDSGASLIVEGINEDAGTLTMSGNVNSISGISDGDVIFTEGDYQSAGQALKIQGLGMYMPFTAPGATLFNGVDRTAHVTRLAGHRIDGTGLQIDEALSKSMTRVHRSGIGNVKDIFVCPSQWEVLQARARTKLDYVQVKVGNFMFDALKMGQAMIYHDYNCPPDLAYGLDMSKWGFKSLGMAPHVLSLGTGQGAVTVDADSDSVGVRVGCYGNLWCSAPGSSFVCKLPVPT